MNLLPIPTLVPWKLIIFRNGPGDGVIHGVPDQITAADHWGCRYQAMDSERIGDAEVFMHWPPMCMAGECAARVRRWRGVHPSTPV